MDIMISIIIPAFNCSAALSECLSALKKQTVKPLETIVVDDGSLDDTAEVAESFDDVQVIRCLKQKGAGAARVTGAKKARGDIIAFLDADCLIVNPEMDMLEMPAVSAVKDIGYGGISAGVLVLEPDEEIYKDMLVEINNTEYDNTYSDQSFLDWYLKKKDMWNEIPIHYNALQH